jgi:hypothetical protein
MFTRRFVRKCHSVCVVVFTPLSPAEVWRTAHVGARMPTLRRSAIAAVPASVRQRIVVTPPSHGGPALCIVEPSF